MKITVKKLKGKMLYCNRKMYYANKVWENAEGENI